jgi:ribosomal-protein-alanine N-acetyltransferase
MSINKAFITFPQLETKNLFLRKIHPSDAGDLFEVLSDDEVTEFYDDDAFTNISQASEQIEAWENGFKNNRCIRWGITRKEEGIVIGSCGYYGFHTWHKRASIGYELARPYWRQGIMSEALYAIINFGFSELELNRIEAVVMPGNTASIIMLDKLGFRNEGQLLEYENWGSKGFVDLCMFATRRKVWNIPEK